MLPRRIAPAHEKVCAKVVEGAADIASKIKLAPGLDPATEMRPLVSSEQFDRVTGYIRSRRDQGARGRDRG